MQFSVIEKKSNDLYVIYDMQTGGKCCCSLYTLRQLQNMGNTVYGLHLDRTRNVVQEMTKEGKIRVKHTVYSVDETKRSATTISKGIPLTKEEKKKLKEKQELQKEEEKKKQQYLLEKKKLEVLRLQEERDKEKELSKWKKNRKRAKIYKTKPLFILTSISEKASEYDTTETYTYTVYLHSPTSITVLTQISKEFSRAGKGFYVDSKELNNLLKSTRGNLTIQLRLQDCVTEELYPISLAVASEFSYFYMNYYTDERYSIKLKASDGYTVPEKCKEYSTGSVAYGDVLSSYTNWLRKLPYVY